MYNSLILITGAIAYFEDKTDYKRNCVGKLKLSIIFKSSRQSFGMRKKKTTLRTIFVRRLY